MFKTYFCQIIRRRRQSKIKKKISLFKILLFAFAVLFAQHFAGWATNIDLSAMDVNNDGYVNVSDLVLLSQYLAGWDIKLGEKN